MHCGQEKSQSQKTDICKSQFRWGILLKYLTTIKCMHSNNKSVDSMA